MSAPIPPIGVRIPSDIKEKIKAAAAVNRRSMNAEIVFALGSIYEGSEIHEKADARA